jgi:hypothetical protein
MPYPNITNIAGPNPDHDGQPVRPDSTYLSVGIRAVTDSHAVLDARDLGRERVGMTAPAPGTYLDCTAMNQQVSGTVRDRAGSPGMIVFHRPD